jgi:hypothetical protein
MTIGRNGRVGGYVGVSLTLFAGLFAAQAAVIAMAPVLTQAASDLGVSTAAAGSCGRSQGSPPACRHPPERERLAEGFRRRLCAVCLECSACVRHRGLEAIEIEFALFDGEGIAGGRVRRVS